MDSIKLVRHGLGILDLSDIDEKSMNVDERRTYCASMSAAWPILEKDMKKFMHKQLMFAVNQAESWEQVLVGRGAFAGMELLFEHWQAAVQEHLAGLPKEDFDKHDPIGEM